MPLFKGFPMELCTLLPSGDSIKNCIKVDLGTQMGRLKANIDCTDFPYDCLIFLQTCAIRTL